MTFLLWSYFSFAKLFFYKTSTIYALQRLLQTCGVKAGWKSIGKNNFRSKHQVIVLKNTFHINGLENYCLLRLFAASI